MIALAIKALQTHRHFVLYAFIGLFGVAIDVATLHTLDKLTSWHYQVSNGISTSLGIGVNFLLNFHYNFRVKGRVLLRVAVFYLVGMVGLATTAMLLAVFIGWLNLPVTLAKVCTLPIVLLLQYSLNRHITFRGHSNQV